MIAECGLRPPPFPPRRCEKIDLVLFHVIPAKFSMPRLEAWHPRMDENPPSPPFSKGGLGGFQGYFLTKPESSCSFIE